MLILDKKGDHKKSLTSNNTPRTSKIRNASVPKYSNMATEQSNDTLQRSLYSEKRPNYYASLMSTNRNKVT